MNGVITDCPGQRLIVGILSAYDESQEHVKVLIASTSASGHLYPLLSVGRALLSEGHQVVVLSAAALRETIEDSGATFRAFPRIAEFDLRHIEAECPEFFDCRVARS